MGFTGTHRIDRRRLRAALLVVGLFVALWVVVSIIISATLLRPFGVAGDSMSPTLQHGQRLAAFLPGAPERRDIVILDIPPHAKPSRSATFVKRVVAVGGDIVSCCSNGHLVVNGDAVDEPFAVATQPRFASVRVPDGDLFVLGDNRMDSEDSRSWGPIPAKLVIGRVVAHGAAAVVLSPLVLGGLVALALTIMSWIVWIRPKHSPGPEDRGSA